MYEQRESMGVQIEFINENTIFDFSITFWPQCLSSERQTSAANRPAFVRCDEERGFVVIPGR